MTRIWKFEAHKRVYEQYLELAENAHSIWQLSGYRNFAAHDNWLKYRETAMKLLHAQERA